MLGGANARLWKAPPGLIDYFALALTHALIAIALLRLAGRDATDSDPAFDEVPGEAANEGGDGQARDA